MQVNEVIKSYLNGASQDETMLKYGIKQYEYFQIVNRLADNYRIKMKEDRIQQARIMEEYIFDMIKKEQDVSNYINEFSRFCA